MKFISPREVNIIESLKNQKGTLFLVAFFLLIIFMLFIALAADIAYLMAIKIEGRHSLNLALRAAAQKIDEEAFTDADNPRIVIDETAASEAFIRVLKQNLKLDANFNPLPGSPVDDKVEVCYFQIVQEENVPYGYSYRGRSETLQQPGCIGIIRIPVRLSPFARLTTGLGEYTNIYVHSSVVPEVFEEGI